MTDSRKNKGGRPPKHGGYSYLARGGEGLPEKRKHIADYLTNCREGLIADLGPKEGDLTAAQLILIDRAIMKLGCVRLMEEHVSETGVMKGNHLAPCLRSSYLAYNNSVRLDLAALGINKKRADEFDLEGYVNEKYGGKGKDSNGEKIDAHKGSEGQETGSDDNGKE